MQTFTDRQQQILEVLHTQPSISIEEIKEHFAVSTATAYRDVQVLISAEVAVKTNHGLKLAPPPEPSQKDKCFFCNGPTNERTAFIIQMQDGNQRSACCPHCGLMALHQSGVLSAMSCDFIYGRMVNARQATFVLGSAVNLCCEPSVLCFGSEEEAQRFQQGFGGSVYSLESALTHLEELMKL